ncbi:MAG: ferritin family protein [Anaerolineae bacterium]|nr:ferritin family protein [Anaerolineae bacterium]
MSELNAAIAVLQMAIQTEIDGHNFYQKFAERSTEPDARRIFERLARDEIMHLEMLRNTKAMLEQSGEWAEYKGLALDVDQGAPIFSQERVKQNVVAHTSDLSALRVAYLIEKDAVDFYTRAAAQTDNPNGRRMFRDLADMEQDHLRLLEGEYNRLMSYFQTEMGFAPF